MPRTLLEIVERARLLAADLAHSETPVEKNVLRSLVADFTAVPDPSRLRQMLDLVLTGSGGHLLRGQGYGDQVRMAAREILRVLGEGWEATECRTLFGWTARLLLVARQATESNEEAREPKRPAQNHQRSRQSKAGNSKPQEKGVFQGLGAKNREALLAFKKGLTEGID